MMEADSKLEKTEAGIERNGFGDGHEPPEPAFHMGEVWNPDELLSKYKAD